MKKRYIIIVLAILILFTLALSELLSAINTLNQQVSAMQSEITAIRKHDTTQDRMLGEVAIVANKPKAEPQKQAIEQSPVVPAIIPLPAYIGAFEAIKQFIFGR